MSFKFTKTYAIGTLAMISSTLHANDGAKEAAEFNPNFYPYLQTEIKNDDHIDIIKDDTINVFQPYVIEAFSSEKDVVYKFNCGSKLVRRGGTRAWRNNNPGNLRYGNFARENGAIGTAGGFAVFPDEETGMRALKKLLRSNTYSKLSISAAINKYAPPVENNTQRYKTRLSKMTGLPLSTKLATLNENQLNEVALAIRAIEGWKPGNENYKGNFLATNKDAAIQKIEGQVPGNEKDVIQKVAQNKPNPFLAAAYANQQNTL